MNIDGKTGRCQRRKMRDSDSDSERALEAGNPSVSPALGRVLVHPPIIGGRKCCYLLKLQYTDLCIIDSSACLSGTDSGDHVG